MRPELIADYRCGCGEGPLWHPDEKCVYWLDLEDGRMFRYDPLNGRHEQVYQGETIGGFTIQEDGALLCCMTHGAIRTWRDGVFTTLMEEIPEERSTTFNDVIADPQGRVYCGTLPTKDRLGRLYRLDVDGTLTIMVEGIGCSNGMGFSLDHRAMYYTDSGVREIYRFDYDKATGALANQRLFARLREDQGLPDGMTVDAEGCLWSARWDGGCVARYAPDGTELSRIELPAKKVSCVTFGGDDYGDMYITTAGGPVQGLPRCPWPARVPLAHPSLLVTQVAIWRSRLR
jgi:sugar lactone lactonase YvrE